MAKDLISRSSQIWEMEEKCKGVALSNPQSGAEQGDKNNPGNSPSLLYITFLNPEPPLPINEVVAPSRPSLCATCMQELKLTRILDVNLKHTACFGFETCMGSILWCRVPKIPWQKTHKQITLH